MAIHRKRDGLLHAIVLRLLIATAIATAATALARCGADVSLPPVDAHAASRHDQAQSFLQALEPRRPGRPVVALLALNEGTETTDFLLPHAVLQRAGVADVQTVAPRRGRVTLYPALEVEVEQDLAGFDRRHPSGADYVIVPAMRDADDPEISTWLQRQAAQGARIIGVCAGALMVGRAGLLDGRRFTTHWYYRGTVLERHPGATYVPHARYVVDRGVATTTGITASVPTMLALVEAIAGRAKAQSLAAELGVSSWGPAHDSSSFRLDAGRMWSYVLDRITFWRHERWSVEVRDGMSDVALALAVDAWSRTGLVSVQAVSESGPVTLRSGVVLAAQTVAGGADTPRLPLASALRPMQQLERTLCQIAERYGPSRRERVMLELEYAGEAGATACAG